MIKLEMEREKDRETEGICRNIGRNKIRIILTDYIHHDFMSYLLKYLFQVYVFTQ